MQHKIRSIILLLLVAAGLLAGGCVSPATPSPGPTVMLPTTAPVPTPAMIQVTDAAGQTLRLGQVPQRLVVIGRGPYMTLHLLYMFPTAWNKLIGLEKRGTTADDFLPLVDTNWSKKVVLELGPNAEQVAALKPDLVIIKGTVPDAISSNLAQVGIPTLFLDLETPERFYQDVTNLGAVLGQESRAQEIISYYKESLGRIQQRLGGLSEGDKPRVLLLEYTDRGGTFALNLPARSWMQTIQAQAAGGHPVWLEAAGESTGWTVANLEQIAVWNPDKIFLDISYTYDPREVIAKLASDPMWSQLKATQNSELYAFPYDLYRWDLPGPRWILGVTWLATRMHPDKFVDLDMNAEVYRFFGYFYGMDQAAVDANILPKVQMDVH